MSLLKAIFIASLSIPALVFLVFFGAGIVILVAEVIDSGAYDKGWLGIIFAGSAYAYFALLLSTVPTIILGLPMGLMAKKYGILNKKVIYMGAVVAGGLFLAVSDILFFKAVNIELILWSFVVGGIGGLVNGYVFSEAYEPNNRMQSDAAEPRR
jgi:hypothetical protein